MNTERKGADISLQVYQQRHDALTVAWLNRADIRETFGLTRSLTAAAHRQWIDGQQNLLIWAICDAAGRHIGNTTLRIDPRHRQGYFEIYLGESDCRGRGYGRQALDCVLAYAFGELDLHRVWLLTLPENVAAENLYRRAGFVLEGRQRQAILRNGRFQDQLQWSILCSEWRLASGGSGR